MTFCNICFTFHLNRLNHIKNKVANPRNERKPNTSVIVVKITADAKAGSIFRLSSTSGITIPEKPAISKFSIIIFNISHMTWRISKRYFRSKKVN